jgi:hypothetical protein
MPLKPIKTKERFENLIKTPRGVVTYAEHKKTPVPELEHVILLDDLAIYWYAYYVLHSRWPKGEQILLRGAFPKWGPNAYVLSRYAETIIKDRWPEAEPFIKKDSSEWKNYSNNFNIQD